MNKVLDKKRLCEQFVGGDCQRFILGRNPFAQSVITALSPKRIDGIIDEFTTDNSFMGIPIIHSLAELPSDGIVLSAALLNPITIKRKLDSVGVKHIDYFSMLHYCPDLPIKRICFWEGFHDSYVRRRNEYNAIYERLSDDESKDVFRRIMDFRFNYNVDAMDVFTNREKEQYFEPFLELASTDSFIDVGGYDGNTTLEFIKRCPDYGNIWFFEPEENNLRVAKNNMKDFSRIIYCPVAASDKVGELRFEPSKDSSQITSKGSVVVNSSLIDNYFLSPYAASGIEDKCRIFMKMDIEGAERQAITGAVDTILGYHPTMAISVYHRGTDFIDIPKQVLSIRDDYRIYLRHYTEGISETVMFFVPTKNG